MKQVLFFSIVLFIYSCKPSNDKISLYTEPTKFSFNGFDWDPIPYMFSDSIVKNVLEQRGPEMAATRFSYIGNHQKTLEFWDQRRTKETIPLRKGQIDTFNQKFLRKDAIPYILERTGGYKVTIINEEHHMPETRVFTTQLLKSMYEQGYRHLGLETFFGSEQSIAQLHQDKYPRLKNGIYTTEPQFGQLVRAALKLGYNIFPYESQGHENGKEREINQAKNIKDYLEKNTEGKVLIHCGYAHGAEGNYGGSWEKAMAGRLTEFTGIDPFTINQTKYVSRSKPSYNDAYYQILDVESPSVFLDEDGKVFGKYRNESHFDVSVIHPKTVDYERPIYLQYGNRKEVDVIFQHDDMQFPVMVLAYVKGEEIGEAIPYDVQEIFSSDVKLVLEPGLYTIILLDVNGKATMAGLDLN